MIDVSEGSKRGFTAFFTWKCSRKEVCSRKWCSGNCNCSYMQVE